MSPREEGMRTVGFAVSAEKAKKHFSPKLKQLSAEAGIALKVIDLDKSFEEQEPFDVLLHKVRSQEWHHKLDEYRRKRPNLRVVDKLQSVMQLSNRINMLAPMKEDIVLMAPKTRETRGAPQFMETGCRHWERIDSTTEMKQQILSVGAPNQIVIEEGMSPAEAREAAGNAGLTPPLLGKSVWADGRAGSHGLVVIKDFQGLSQMITGPRPSAPELPIVLQQYTPHGACLFKVYVMGPITILVRRPSLQIPVPRSDIEEEVGSVQSVIRVSSSFSNSELGDAPQEEPPNWAIQALAQELRQRYNMDLFNFDLIQPEATQTQGTEPSGKTDFLLLDVNAFPGYEKLPDYEELYLAFLKSLFAKDKSQEQKVTRFVVSPRPSAKQLASTVSS